jgi:ComEC/Rec2-related protein
MNTLSEQETPAFQWHFLLVLLPFILGIYLADYRNLTDTAIYFFNFETILSVVFICFGRSRKWALLGLSFALGFWLQYFAQANFTTQRQFAFSNDVIGHFDPQQIEIKGALQKIKGVFSYISAGKIKQMELLCYVKNAPSVQADYSYLLRCKPERIVNDTYPGAFDQERYYQLQNVSHRVFCNAEDLFKYKRTEKSFFLRNLAAIKATISRDFTQALSPKAAVIARALILGERDGIDQELRSYFLATGSMHILAVSGMHIGLLILALLYILGWLSFCLTRKQALLLVVGIVWYYAVLTGLSASVLRSVFMFSVLLLSQLTGKQMNQLNALFFSAFCLLLYDPLYLFDLGFQLSYLAMLGIYLYYEPIKNLACFKWRQLQQLWEGFALGLAATLTTLPLSMYHFHLYPNYAQVAGLCLMSLSSLILVVGMLFPLLNSLPLLDQLGNYTLELSIKWMLQIMQFFSHLPGALAEGFALPFWWVLLFWLASFGLFYSSKAKFNYYSKTLMLLCLVYMSFQRHELHDDRQISYLSKEQLLFLRNGNQAFAIGIKNETKNAFALQALSTYYNCQIKYLQLKKGKNNFHFKYTRVQITLRDHLRIKLKTKKQSDKMKVY